jgi:5'-AMP-activated protein kinase catalytic alpha subunit
MNIEQNSKKEQDKIIYKPNNKNNKIGNYEIIKTLGEGTFGKVKLAIHIPTNEKVAIKILEKSRIEDNEDLECINREITFLKTLNHINIISLYEIIENSEYYYIIMEYAENDLFTFIVQNNFLSEETASLFYYQIIKVIEYIHKYKIVHRDLKPENILLTNNNTIIKIIDFGLANSYKKENENNIEKNLENNNNQINENNNNDIDNINNNNNENLLNTLCGSPC